MISDSFASNVVVASMLKRPRTPPTNNLAMDYQTADSEHVLKRSRPYGLSDDANNLPVNILPVTYPVQGPSHSLQSSDDLPKTVVANLNQGSAVKSMDFHPVQQTLLLVGTNIGDIAVWDVGSRERQVFRNFKVWDIGRCTMTLQASLVSEYTASVNRVMWSPDGTLFGVAYSKHIVHTMVVLIYGTTWRLMLLLVMSAILLSLIQTNNYASSLLDKAIWVWDAVTGSKQYTCEGGSWEEKMFSISNSSFQLVLMGRLRLGLMIMRVQELIMTHQDIPAQLWLTVLMGQGCSHVGLLKKENHTSLTGMKVKGLSSGCIMVLGSGLSVLCNLIQQKVDFWLLVMSL
ncbi:Topless-related protein [Actinidia chinensis var. chinensis]|uniref:Topless-related protein n=1 Tax=Actinidia chinensis var. chinensis TaxID=1590841 RepID=A0A2R6R9H0_ACTCC|nr:Topless-related protein [Actinidia chinensis var. chinensis]